MAISSARATCAPMHRCGPKPKTSGLARRTVDAELEGILEHLLVAIGRRPVQRHLVAGADLLAVQLAVLGGGPREVADRRDPTKDLLDGVGQEVGMGPQLLPLIGELAEGLHAAGDGVAGRLVARLDQELAVGDQLLAGQGHSVDLALHQLGDQVVLGILRGAPRPVCLK